MNRLKELRAKGQAVWLDYIRRDILENGTLQRLIREDGVSGVTSNPAIFQQAIGDSDLYDQPLQELLAEDSDRRVEEIYEELVIADIRLAADLLRPTFEATAGLDGYVSLEVSPHLARDTAASVTEARRLWQRVARPNLMIKIPATREGIPAIEQLLGEGINVNVTLMFSPDHYEAVAQAYLRALPHCPAPERIASVASFFVSRVDTKVDRLLETLDAPAAAALRGRIAIANSRLTYERYRELFTDELFAEWRRRGARPQRLLWASTSTKNPRYRDVVYVEGLIGPETVNTVPPVTLDAFRDHGEADDTLLQGVEEARRQVAALATLGVTLEAVGDELQREGLEQFAQPYDALLATLDQKRRELARRSTTLRVAE